MPLEQSTGEVSSPDLHCSHSLDPGWHPGDLWKFCSLQHQCKLPGSPSSSCWPHFRGGVFIMAGWKKRTLSQPCDDLYLQLHPFSEHILLKTLSQKLPPLVHTWGCESVIVHACMCRHKRTTQKYFFIVLIVFCSFFTGLDWIYTDLFCSESLLLLILGYWGLPYISRHMHALWAAFLLPLVAAGDPLADAMWNVYNAWSQVLSWCK